MPNSILSKAILSSNPSVGNTHHYDNGGKNDSFSSMGRLKQCCDVPKTTSSSSYPFSRGEVGNMRVCEVPAALQVMEAVRSYTHKSVYQHCRSFVTGKK